jgi:hypothetical protein
METSEQVNIGFDARFFSKLNANFDFYVKTTKDWLVKAPILGTAGTGAPFINGGDVKKPVWNWLLPGMIAWATELQQSVSTVLIIKIK